MIASEVRMIEDGGRVMPAGLPSEKDDICRRISHREEPSF